MKVQMSQHDARYVAFIKYSLLVGNTPTCTLLVPFYVSILFYITTKKRVNILTHSHTGGVGPSEGPTRP